MHLNILFKKYFYAFSTQPVMVVVIFNGCNTSLEIKNINSIHCHYIPDNCTIFDNCSCQPAVSIIILTMQYAVWPNWNPLNGKNEGDCLMLHHNLSINCSSREKVKKIKRMMNCIYVQICRKLLLFWSTLIFKLTWWCNCLQHPTCHMLKLKKITEFHHTL